jgi:hypothetical protein
MKRMLSVLLAMAIATSMTSVATAQSDEQMEKEKRLSETVKYHSMNERMMPQPEVQLSRLTRGLKLTEEQQKQIKPLLEQEYAKLNEIRNNEDLSPKRIQKMVEDLRNDTKLKVDKCLTAEQQKSYDLVTKEIKANKQIRVKQNRKDRINSKANQSIE